MNGRVINVRAIAISAHMLILRKRNAVGVDISFFTWIAVAVSMLVAMAPVLFLVAVSATSRDVAVRSLGSDMREHVPDERRCRR